MIRLLPLAWTSGSVFGQVSEHKFVLMSTFGLILSGHLTPAVIGEIEPSANGGNLVHFRMERRRLWLLPGIIAFGLGTVGLVWILLALVLGDRSSIPSVIWVMGLGGIPIGAIWWSSERWLTNLMDPHQTMASVRTALEVVDCTDDPA